MMRSTTLILLSMLLASCSYLNVPLLSPYKMDIRQGNYVTPEMREKLRVGMTKAQVRYVLGTPMINDVFHGNRWDYVYRLERRGKVVEQQQLALYFAGDHLERAEEGGKPVQLAAMSVPVPVPVEVAQTAPQEVVQPVAKADPAAEVLNRVQAWAAAWSARNVQDYLAAYSPGFKPQNMSREAWEKQRLARVGKPGAIEVLLRDVRVSVQDETHATATFTQDYRSDAYSDSTHKTLQLEKTGDIWLIVAEQIDK